jgi:ABC-type transporter Mla MlaB component
MFNADNRTTGRDTYNTAIGYGALMGSTTTINNYGRNNTAVGDYSLKLNSSGDYNIALGGSSLENNTTGDYNTAFGFESLFSNAANNRSTAVGYHAMYYSDSRTSSGRSTYNTALGYDALKGSTTAASNTGRYNTSIGDASMKNNANGSDNVAVGASTLYNNISGIHNVGIGHNTLYTNSGGDYNTAIGSNSMYYNTGNNNTSLGYHAMNNNSTGNHNTAVGFNSLDDITGGSNQNAAIGYNSLTYLTSGSMNTAIGDYAGKDLTSGSNNIYIGHYTQAISSTSNNTLNIGNTIYGTGINQTAYKIGIGTSAPDEQLDVRGSVQVKNSSGAGEIIVDGTSGNSVLEFREIGSYRGSFGYNNSSDYLCMYHGGNVVLKNGLFGVGTTTPGYTLQVGGSGDGTSARANAWNTFSDRRWKTNIVLIDNPIEKLFELNGYYYNWKDGKDTSKQVGVIAQEVEKALPEIVSTDTEGYKSVDYSKIIALLIEVNKKQQQEIEELKISLKMQNEKIDALLEIQSEK